MINQVTLVGRLTKDPELKKTTDGHFVSNVILAVNRSFRNNHGEIDTDFVQCTLWKKAAENTVQYCRKGSVVGITGRIQTRHYDNQDGKRIYVTEVVAESIRFLSSRPSETERRAVDQQRMEHAPAQVPFPVYTPEHASPPYENPNPHPEAPQPPPQLQQPPHIQPQQQAPAHAFSFEGTETIQPAKEEHPIGSL